MTKFKRALSSFLAALFVACVFFSYPIANAAAKKVVKPTVILLSTPKTEYVEGDRVTFNVKASNYKGKVQYRVILWDTVNKVQRELYPTIKGYYNNKYLAGTSTFTVSFPVTVPSTYNITVLVKRAGVKVPYDSYVNTKYFTVKKKVITLNKEGQEFNANLAEVKTDVYMNANNTVVKNAKVSGTIFVNPGVNGNATLDNVTAKEIKILSGGTESIHLKNVKSNTLAVESSSKVRIEAQGITNIENTLVKSSSILDCKGGSLGSIKAAKAEKEYELELRGSFDKEVKVDGSLKLTAAEDAKVSKVVLAPENKDDKITLSGSFDSVKVEKSTEVVLTSDAKVKEVVLAPENKDSKITLSGSFDSVKVEKSAEVVLTSDTKVKEVVLAPENKDSKITLSGSFDSVKVEKSAEVVLTSDTKVNSLTVDKEAETKVSLEKGATVDKLTNDGTATVSGEGTVTSKEGSGTTKDETKGQDTGNTGTTGNTGGTNYPPVVTYDDNVQLNSALNGLAAKLNQYDVVTSAITSIPTLNNYGQTNNVTITFKDTFNNSKISDLVILLRSRAISHGEISSQKDTQTLDAFDSVLSEFYVKVGSSAETQLKSYLSSRLTTLGKPTLAAFVTTPNATNYNELLAKLKTNNYDEYSEISAALHNLVPGNDVTLNEVKAYNMTLKSVTVTSGSNTTTVYSSSDKTISLSEIASALGVNKDTTLETLKGKNAVITVVLTGSKGDYTYTINLK